MSREYDSVGRQGEQALLDGAYELGVIAIGKVGAANGALEEGIASEEHTTILGIEAESAGGVAGCGDTLQRLTAQRQNVSVK